MRGKHVLTDPRKKEKGVLRDGAIAIEGDRIFGRGTADNKGQHTINFAALAQVLAARQGSLGFNVRVLMETGEEIEAAVRNGSS